MAPKDEAGWLDGMEAIRESIRTAELEAAREREQWLFRPCDACGDKYRVWGTQVELLPYCGATRCKRDRS
jgi:hypothetical protein